MITFQHPEYEYLSLLEECLECGTYREGRNGGTYGLFGRQIRFDMSEGAFPVLTTKKVHLNSVIVELLWFLRGDTNVKFLHDHNVSIWDEWADENGELGPVYGAQWRRWNGGICRTCKGDGVLHDPANTFNCPRCSGRGEMVVDQVQNLIEGLKKDPYGRRHIINAWNVVEIPQMALPPCHCLVQFFVADGRLSCQLYQRSADVFLGVPFNITSYALLLELIAREVGLKVGEFVHTFGDVHLYANHVEQAKEQLTRKPLPWPALSIPSNRGIFELEPADIEVRHYHAHPAIKAPVSA